MFKLRLSVAAAILGMAGAAFAQSSTAPNGPVTIKISPQLGSGESGTATLTPQGASRTKVEISLNGQPSGVQQPAHIHPGSCSNLDPKPKQGLNNVVNGKSTTVVPVSLQDLLSGKDAINVHKSTSDIQTYVACGDLQPTAPTGSSSSTGSRY